MSDVFIKEGQYILRGPTLVGKVTKVDASKRLITIRRPNLRDYIWWYWKRLTVWFQRLPMPCWW